MSRHSRFNAVILKTARFGEMHKRVTMLSDDRGLVEAIAYGGYSQKGKLRGVTDMFCAGMCYLYTDPVKESSKITDFDPGEYFEGVKRELTRFFVASLWAEVIIGSYAGGERSDLLHRELLRFLRELEQSSGSRIDVVTIQFLWRYLGFLGVRPNLDHCANCGRSIRAGEHLRYSQVDGMFVCSQCGSEKQRALPWAGVHYLLVTQRMDPSRALEQSLDDAGRRGTKNVLYTLVEHSLERELKTLRTGRGIL